MKKNINGVILLDKDTGMSSNQALQKVKHLLGAKKAGHTGALDPLATGLLPICLGQATKASEYLLNSHKKYTTTIKLGETTDSFDSDGKISEVKPVEVSDEAIQLALQQFRGQIEQVPPMFSALKKDGQPLYKLARQGREIDRPARPMTVFSLEARRLDLHFVELEVHCSSGFYIRSLAHDLGQSLGCGAHVVDLRRTAIKEIGVEKALSLQQLQALDDPENAVLAIDCLLQDMPIIEITQSQATSLLQGRITVLEKSKVTPISRIYTEQGSLFAVGHVGEQGRLKTDKIFMLS